MAILALGILDIIPEPDGAGLIAHYRDACPSGSALAVSNGAQLSRSTADVEGAREVFAQTSTPQLRVRTREQVAALLPGYELLEPGVVPTAAWRPEQPISEAEAARSNARAAVGMLSRPRTWK
ncbi:SAM-dependent methyltransferase [Bounagaea algeriensis]